MSGEWEKYADEATRAFCVARWGEGLTDQADPDDIAFYREGVAAAVAAVGPLIAEDTRARMVAAAARAVDREGAADPRAEIISRLTARRSEITPGRPGWGYLTEAIDMVNEVFGAREAS